MFVRVVILKWSVWLFVAYLSVLLYLSNDGPVVILHRGGGLPGMGGMPGLGTKGTTKTQSLKTGYKQRKKGKRR